MKRLSNEQIMDYLDGTLSAAERAQIEAHLGAHAEDAATVRELQFAMSATQAWHAEEEMRVSENFWPNLRDNLGPAPKRSWWSSLFKGARPTVTAPAARWSMGAALAAIVLALGMMMFAGPGQRTPVLAKNDISAADKMFIQQSVKKHEAYVTSEVAPGDTSARDNGADEDNTEDAIP